MCFIHPGYEAIWLSDLNPYFYSLLFDVGVEIRQSTILFYVDTYAFSVQVLEETERQEEERRDLFISVCLLFLSMSLHFSVASPCLSSAFQFPAYFGSSWTILITHSSVPGPYQDEAYFQLYKISPLNKYDSALQSTPLNQQQQAMPSPGKVTSLALWDAYFELLKY